MTRRPDQPATETPNVGPGRDGTTFDHPAFGQISASRVQANPGRTLYGSDFVHRAWVTLRISRSSFDRSLSRNWHHDREPLIEVDLSEAQWATFVSSLNVGSGVPCTIDRIGREQVPGIARRVETDHFRGEVYDVVTRAIAEVEAAKAEVEGSSLPATKRRSIAERLRQAAQHLRSNLPFVSRSFDEHVEKKVEKAKIEVNAYLTSHVLRVGLERLGAPVVPLELEPPSEGDDR